jgi:hypothetical protein
MGGGSLPTEIGAWTSIQRVNFGINQLTGPLPSTIGAWKGVQWFNVGSNKFAGQLPNTIGAWTGIQNFYLDRNNLSGSVPNIGNFCPLKKTPVAAAEWKADCKAAVTGGEPEVKCDCCNICCDVNGENCSKL